jgi:glycerol uptake facilitator-like aquaporin
MWDIVLFEMIGTGIFAGACSLLSPVVTNETIIFIALVYFSCLVICTPISGGHLNPAYTLAVFILCNNKAAKVTKMLLMMLAQFLGTIIGFAFGRMVRVNIAVDTYYPAYYEPTPAIETLTTIDNYTPVLLFNEVFASSVLCLVFLSLKYRRDLIDKSRDQILNCAALALSLYAVTALTAQIIGLSFLNPVIALV